MTKRLLALFATLILVLLSVVLAPVVLLSTFFTAGLWWLSSLIGEEATRIRKWSRRK